LTLRESRQSVDESRGRHVRSDPHRTEAAGKSACSLAATSTGRASRHAVARQEQKEELQVKRKQRKGGRSRKVARRGSPVGARKQMAQLVESGGDPEDDVSEFEVPDFAAQVDGEQGDEDAEGEASEALADRRLLLAGLRAGEERLLVNVGEFAIEIEQNDDGTYALRLSHETMSEEETQAMAPHLEALSEQEALEDMLVIASPTCWEERHVAEKRLLALIDEARASAGPE
jgi:hypothetical protein